MMKMNPKIIELLNKNSSAYYLFDCSILEQRIAYLRKSLPKEMILCYAIKANPFLVRELRKTVERFEVCSPGEIRICQNAGVKKENMVITGIYKDPAIIEELVADPDFNGTFTSESMRQFELLQILSSKYKRTLRILLRLTNGSQFGMDASEIETLIRNRSHYPFLRFAGIQFFSGTQKYSLKKIRREIEYLATFLQSLKEDIGYEPEDLEYGPGFPVSYCSSDNLNEDLFLSEFSGMIFSLSCRSKLVLELGRSIAASCGTYYTHIVDLKQNQGENYAVIDGGMHQITYFGHHMAMDHPFFSVVGKKDMPGAKAWTICGSLCSMNDILAKKVLLPPLTIGDTLCFENAGAYCMTEGISLFLSRELPSIYLVDEKGDLICIRRCHETAPLNTPSYERIDY